jgi:hypothetical protein
MWVVEKVLPPGMQDGKETDLYSQVTGVGCDGAQSLVHRRKEDAIDNTLIL